MRRWRPTALPKGLPDRTRFAGTSRRRASTTRTATPWRRMRIGIDARELCGRATGAGRYLGGLLTEWSISEHARAHEFVLYAPQPIAMPLDARRFATRE